MTEGLHRLLYRSRSVPSENGAASAAEVSVILQSSRAKNAEAGITGVLLFDGVTFLQALEGPLAVLERLYEHIARDTRHEEIEMIDFTPIETRHYEGWDMAFLDGSSIGHDALRPFLVRVADPNALLPRNAWSAEMKVSLLEANDRSRSGPAAGASG